MTAYHETDAPSIPHQTVQTRSGARGTIVGRTPPATAPEHQRIFVRLWLTIPGPRGGVDRPPAKVIVGYAPEDVQEVRG